MKYAKYILWAVLVFLFFYVGIKQKATICEDCNVIIALEFAHSTDQASQLIFRNSYLHKSDCLCEDIQLNTLYDNIFILIYTSLIILSFYIFWTEVSSRRIPGLWWLLMVTPGICDLIENNYIMLYTSTSIPSPHFFAVYFWLVRLKWALAIPFALLVFAVIIYLIIWLADSSIGWIDEITSKKQEPVAK
jgi:hypothetical protein